VSWNDLGSDDFPVCCGDAPVRRTWDQNHYVLNGYPAGHGWKSNVRYECSACGKELQPKPEVVAAIAEANGGR